jgi:hypothetical protein
MFEASHLASFFDELILFTESLGVRSAVWIEQFLAALLPRRFEFGRRDIPDRPAFLRSGTQVLAEIFQSGPIPDLYVSEAGDG